MGNKRLDGRVMIITGAGRGIGREYALMAARNGAKVVVNDLGSGLHGEASGETPAEEVAAQIIAEGGQAIADHSDVADFEATGAMVRRAVNTFGDLHVLINNAGILRDRMLVNMTPDEWDLTMRVHLRGHFCLTHHAAVYWRVQAKEHGPSDRVLVSTSSISGLHGAVGQTNYASAKAGLATFALLCHRELNANYGVRSYAIAPGARTRLTGSTPHAKASVGQEVAPGTFDFASPANVAPYVMWLTAQGCPIPSGSVFGVYGDKIDVYRPWEIATSFSAGDRQWTFDALDAAASDIAASVPQLAKTQAEKAKDKAGV